MKYITLLFMGLPLLCASQNWRHLDYLGAGHDKEITITSSSNSQQAQKTIDGFDIQDTDQLKDASRFLAQCTFGADMATIQMTAAMGYEAWLDEQFSLPTISMHGESIRMSEILRAAEEEDEEMEEEEFVLGEYSSEVLNTAWLHSSLAHPDILRKRMAFILSEIFVINTRSDIFEDFGQLSSTYYDKLGGNAFGNYRSLIEDVSLSPAMGIFLSHYNNPKEDPANNIHPDENYAREIMQLFSIGLWELNQDGSRKRDAQGKFIPTYSNADIKEFAQVFTGLSDGGTGGDFGQNFEEGASHDTPLVPMRMYDAHHDMSSKRLPNGVVLPPNQDGLTDISMALDHLSTHSNTAPFISKALIQFMTTSNPSADYIRSVADAFDPMAENNFQEVIKAILLHPEARNCSPSSAPYFSKLREPLVRQLNYLRAYHMTPDASSSYFTEFECFDLLIGQMPLKAPSVFNFFRPDYRPSSSVEWNYLVAPEFQILNSTNSIGIVNEADKLAIRRLYLETCLNGDPEGLEVGEEDPESWEENYLMDYTKVMELASQPEALVNYLDILLANGLLTDATKNIVIDAVSALEDEEQRVMMANYLILISPDYAILK